MNERKEGEVMLDKSLPYAEIWMTRPLHEPVPDVPLAEGFHFGFYEPGAEKDWAAIETSVGEFENEEEALIYFQKTFAPYPEELAERMIFVVTETGERVATCSAWRKERQGQSYPVFHWLAVKPGYQGKGIAKALTAKVLSLFPELSHNSPIYLHTQTWSYPAVKLYKKFGFDFIAENMDGTMNPDYEKAQKIIEENS
jgi:ribosomal protein S18 acetylase RimI-like enzyme